MTECQSVRGEWGQPCPDCGQTLPVAKPWEQGRPCAKTALDRGRGWDGSPAPEHTAGVKARWSTMARTPKPESRIQINRPPAAYQLTARAAQMLEAVQRHGGNRSAAARDLGVSQPAVGQCMDRLARHGVPVPPPTLRRARKVA